MSVIQRNGGLYGYFRHEGELIGLRLLVKTKREGKEQLATLKRVLKTRNFSSLDPTMMELVERLFRNRNWELPADLIVMDEIRPELILWNGVLKSLGHPEIKGSPVRERLEYCFSHIVEKWGKDMPVKSIWITQIKQYQQDRLNEGAAPATVNREKAALSKMFQVLMEERLADANPARMVKNLSEKSGERQVYISFRDFNLILGHLPVWYRLVVLMAYYMGMRKGEIHNLRRSQVNLSKRIILLGPEDTKEGNWKRVPIHLDLVPVLEDTMKLRSGSSDKCVFHFVAGVDF